MGLMTVPIAPNRRSDARTGAKVLLIDETPMKGLLG